MKVGFRVRYHTRPGEVIWLSMKCQLGADGGWLGQEVPLRFRDVEEWEGEMAVEAPAGARLEYRYEMRDEGLGVVLAEYGGARVVALDPGRGALFLHDTWRAHGSLDSIYDAAAFDTLLPAPREAGVPADPPGANHEIELHMAAVPAGMRPAIVGGVRELGDWDWSRAVPMEPVGRNRWRVRLDLPADWRIEYKYGFHDPSDGGVIALEEGANRVLHPRVLGPGQFTRVADEGFNRPWHALFRGAGVAVPVFALRSRDSCGVGEFADLEPFAAWAAGAGLRLLQILPVNDTTSNHDWTDSYPYSAISVFALHPLYLRVSELAEGMPEAFQQELAAVGARLNGLPEIDHEAVMAAKLHFAREIHRARRATIVRDPRFMAFVQVNRHWLPDYAAFCLLRDRFGTADFSRWGEWAEHDRGKIAALTEPGAPDWPEVSFHYWLQFELDRQLARAVAAIHRHGLVLKGDLPIGIDRRSVDAWAAPHLFKLDSQAGAPPDDFAVKGQNWGFPTYDWEVMRRDGYAWWRSRFGHLSRFFDAFRIDHILGFFRIWQVPAEQIEGILGFFDPALPVEADELRARGIDCDPERLARPYIREHHLTETLGGLAERARRDYLLDLGGGRFGLRAEVATQRAIAGHFAAGPADLDEAARGRLCGGLMELAAEVLLIEAPGSGGGRFHVRVGMHSTRSFRELPADQRGRLDALYVDYFYRRQERFWEARGLEKLPAMREASRMLLCGEDLGMVPACVPGVLDRLGILSLEIQRMPKNPRIEFFHPAHAPYLSVVSTSTHDMATLRAWWREDAHRAARFAWHLLGMAAPPAEMTGEIAARVLDQHLHSPAMWAILPLQDLLAIDESLRHPDPERERINVPAIIPFYWRYRMHLGIEDLAAADGFNTRLRGMIGRAGRCAEAGDDLRSEAGDGVIQGGR